MKGEQALDCVKNLHLVFQTEMGTWGGHECEVEDSLLWRNLVDRESLKFSSQWVNDNYRLTMDCFLGVVGE